MKHIALVGLLFSMVFYAGCQERKSTDDPEALKKILFDYFDGIRNKDFGQMTQATTADFVLYEMGRVWNNDSVFNEMKRFPYSVNFTFDNFTVNADANYAHMTYYNHGDFLFDGVEEHFDWIESAAFKRTGNGWKMYFLHITERDAHEAKASF